MKKILGFVIVLGFVIMLGAAGSADVAGMNFGKVFALELLGVAVSSVGMIAMSHYKRYIRRRRRNSKYVSRVNVAEKELA